MYIWANSEYIRFCSTATAVENHMKAEFSGSGSFRRRYIRRNSLTFLTGPFLDPLMKKGGFKKGQTRLVHSMVNSRYIQVHSGQFGEHSILQHSGRC